MPEGHTIHRTASLHSKRFANYRVQLASPQGRFADEAGRLNRRKLNQVEAHGKHLFYFWRTAIVHIHLGLYGKFRDIRPPFPEPRDTVRLRLTGNGAGFDLIGPNRCEIISPEGYQEIKLRLGADPLRSDADPTDAWERISKSRAPIGKLLLDQSIIAGVGNIYRADVLFHVQVHPETLGKELSRETFDRMWNFLCHTMRIGKKYNRIITSDPEEIGKPLTRMNRTERLLVYKKENCVKCDATVQSWDLGGRMIHACPRCQRRLRQK